MRIDPDPAGSELSLLSQYLDYQRQTMLSKTNGLTREQLARKHPSLSDQALNAASPEGVCVLGVDCPAGHDGEVLIDATFPQTTNWDHCFLCATRLTSENRSDEHVFPKWLLHRHGLWDQEMVLLNGTRIQYRYFTIPCCKQCNTEHLSALETKVRAAFEKGVDAVRALGETTVGGWLSKIHYGLLFRSRTLTWDRSSPEQGPIITSQWLEGFRTQHLLLQALRGALTYAHPHGPFSVLIYTCQTGEPAGRCFDYVDSAEYPFTALRSNEVGLVGVLQDWGTMSACRNNIVPLRAAAALTLHPEQFTEAVAVARFTFEHRRDDTHIFFGRPPGGGWVVGPVPMLYERREIPYDNFTLSEFVPSLAAALHVPPSAVTDIEGRVTSRLTDRHGKPFQMPWNAYTIPDGSRLDLGQ